MTAEHLKAFAHLELIWQVLGEPRVGLDASNGDPVGWVSYKDLAHHVQALPGDVQVGGEAILHPHDPLQYHTTFKLPYGTFDITQNSLQFATTWCRLSSLVMAKSSGKDTAKVTQNMRAGYNK